MAVLAVLTVRGGAVATQSPAAVKFDPATGLVNFPNPKNLTAVPTVSYISPNADDATETVFIKQYDNLSVTVWQGAQDTSGRNHPPKDFTLIVAATD